MQNIRLDNYEMPKFPLNRIIQLTLACQCVKHNKANRCNAFILMYQKLLNTLLCYTVEDYVMWGTN